MKKILKKLLLALVGENRLKLLFKDYLLSSRRDPVKLQFILGILRNEIVDDMFSYPSIVNNGYLHIERAISILKDRKVPVEWIVDVGAAGGETCILFSKAFPSAKIIGFEPIRETFNRLTGNVANYPNIQIHHHALGNKKGAEFINVMSRITASSIFESAQNSSLNGNHFFDQVEQERIEIDLLDNVLTQRGEIGLIKMDVQGYELEVLKGGAQTLRRTHFVLLEMQNHEIYNGAPKYYILDAFLREAGFELFEMIPSIRENRQIKEFDALYINLALGKS
jgi:FkbM family methyltransferase